jgi:hypothetical protein
MKKFISRGLVGVLLVGSLGGCASKGILIGAAPSDPPPQIFFLGARDGKGNDYLTWENVSSFGPVPPELKQAGDSACRAVSDELRAIGYHPEARGRDGIEITGGGFFCQPVIFGAN